MYSAVCTQKYHRWLYIPDNVWQRNISVWKVGIISWLFRSSITSLLRWSGTLIMIGIKDASNNHTECVAMELLQWPVMTFNTEHKFT